VLSLTEIDDVKPVLTQEDKLERRQVEQKET
jgi:hypothetical protein